jgi:hypothetical protein
MADGAVEEIEVDDRYERGARSGGRWFTDRDRRDLTMSSRPTQRSASPLT